MARRRNQVRIVEALADRGGLACRLVRRTRLAVTQLLLGDCKHDVAALDAVTALDEPLPSRNPGVCLPDLASKEGGERKPEHTTRGARPVVRLNEETMQAFEGSLKLEDAAGQARAVANRSRSSAWSAVAWSAHRKAW